jgi:CBS domain containing-hemolysin-like protein
MGSEFMTPLVVSMLLVVVNAFFVAAEYATVAAKRSRIEALAKQGNRTAQLFLREMRDVRRLVAGIQVAITLIGLGMGAVTEPFISRFLSETFDIGIPRAASATIALILTTYVLVVFGELVPKYVTMQTADRVALMVIHPLVLFNRIMSPLVWLVERSGALVLRPFGITTQPGAEESVSKEELLLMLRAGSTQGALDQGHARFLSRTLRLDNLRADDIMVHRLDIKWVPLNTEKDDLPKAVAAIPHSRIPVCGDDIDEVVGILYLQDFIKQLASESLDLKAILRPVVAVPETATVDQIIERMREDKTQILIVMDEYGGTSGLITLEDVVEEIFGELEDQIESERPPIERFSPQRLSARADVRVDELLEFLGKDHDVWPSTDTLAEVVINELKRVPRLGDSLKSPIGLLRVENMARRRITRVSVQLTPEAEAVEP